MMTICTFDDLAEDAATISASEKCQRGIPTSCLYLAELAMMNLLDGKVGMVL